MEERIQKAVGLFKQGFNCSQSVCAAFADLYGYTPEQALKMSASFGGGIGRMRQTCGAGLRHVHFSRITNGYGRSVRPGKVKRQTIVWYRN